MVSVERAFEIASKYAKRYGNIVIIKCLEKKDYYVFATNIPDVEDIAPDMPAIQVFKSTGDVQEMLWCEPYIDKKTGQWVDPLEGAKTIDITKL